MTEFWCASCADQLEPEPERLSVGCLGSRPCVACGKMVDCGKDQYAVLRDGALRNQLTKMVQGAENKNVVPLSVYFVLIGNRRFVCPVSYSENPISLSPCEAIPLQGDVWQENYE